MDIVYSDDLPEGIMIDLGDVVVIGGDDNGKCKENRE